MNIRPGVYLACIYGAVIVVILFFILLRPGISNPGSVLTINSDPWGAAVLVDGIYAGVTPAGFFVPRGQRVIELRLPGFVPQTIEKNVGGRVFASLIFPRRVEIRVALEAPQPALAFIDEAAEFVGWTFAGEPTAARQIPLSLSEGAYRLGPAASDPAVREYMEDIVAAAARFAVTRSSLRDLIRAKTLLDNSGLSPSPLTLLASAQDMIAFLGANPAAALALGEVLTGDAQSALLASSWYERAQEAATAGMPGAELWVGGVSLQAGGLNFRQVNGGYLTGRNFPSGTTVNTFYISETLVTLVAWELFLAQHPQWGREYTAALVEEGLAREGHLVNVIIPGAPTQWVSAVSWYAAQAFCQWLTGFLPPQFAAWEVRLPTEAEWEHAARVGALNSGIFWEWGKDPFAPFSFISAPASALVALGSPERPVRGGSWVNAPGSVDIQTRGSLPPSFSSPFVSFRPIIALRGNQP